MTIASLIGFTCWATQAQTGAFVRLAVTPGSYDAAYVTLTLGNHGCSPVMLPLNFTPTNGIALRCQGPLVRKWSESRLTLTEDLFINFPPGCEFTRSYSWASMFEQTKLSRPVTVSLSAEYNGGSALLDDRFRSMYQLGKFESNQVQVVLDAAGVRLLHPGPRLSVCDVVVANGYTGPVDVTPDFTKGIQRDVPREFNIYVNKSGVARTPYAWVIAEQKFVFRAVRYENGIKIEDPTKPAEKTGDVEICWARGDKDGAWLTVGPLLAELTKFWHIRMNGIVGGRLPARAHATYLKSDLRPSLLGLMLTRMASKRNQR